ncbi:hypothetical protein [Paenibacillus taichungensis]|uniref:hypothetical protein n=1 Tax=Paenibacillus taichungensis TaxID=484184 RepID=UPI00399FAFA6
MSVDELQILKEIDNSYVREIATSYLELNALIDEGNQIAIENKDLFEPAIKLYERGGHFFIRAGLICVIQNENRFQTHLKERSENFGKV